MKILARRVCVRWRQLDRGMPGGGCCGFHVEPPISGPEDTLRLFWSSMATRSERLGKLAADDPLA